MPWCELRKKEIAFSLSGYRLSISLIKLFRLLGSSEVVSEANGLMTTKEWRPWAGNGVEMSGGRRRAATHKLEKWLKRIESLKFSKFNHKFVCGAVHGDVPKI